MSKFAHKGMLGACIVGIGLDPKAMRVSLAFVVFSAAELIPALINAVSSWVVDRNIAIRSAWFAAPPEHRPSSWRLLTVYLPTGMTTYPVAFMANHHRIFPGSIPRGLDRARVTREAALAVYNSSADAVPADLPVADQDAEGAVVLRHRAAASGSGSAGPVSSPAGVAT